MPLLNKITTSISNMINHYKTPLYLIAWGVISLVSSYNDILKLDFSFIKNREFYCGILGPLMIWIIAFFIDYIYTISKIEEDEELDKKWTRATYEILCVILGTILLSFYHHDALTTRLLWMTILFVGIILLKAASLCIIRPSKKIRTV